jgi:hypothetical protein
MTPAPILSFAVAVIASLTAGAATGEPAPPQVSPLVVVAGPGPKVVASYPADGGSAPAGVIVLKITFDQPMTADAWSYSKAETGAFPPCLAHPRLLNDQRTFSLLCTVSANETYAIAINLAPRFVSADGRSASAYVLKFTTSDVGVRDMHTALIQAGLTDVDDPIMTWRDDGKGVSQSPAHP